MVRAIGFGIAFIAALLLGGDVQAARQGQARRRNLPRRDGGGRDRQPRPRHPQLRQGHVPVGGVRLGYGFGKATYTIAGRHLRSDQAERQGGDLGGSGMVSGNLISGDALWLGPDAPPVRCTSAARSGDAQQPRGPAHRRAGDDGVHHDDEEDDVEDVVRERRAGEHREDGEDDGHGAAQADPADEADLAQRIAEGQEAQRASRAGAPPARGRPSASADPATARGATES